MWNARAPQPINVVRPGRPPVVERAGVDRPKGQDGSSLLDGLPSADAGRFPGEDVFGEGAVRLEDLIGLPGYPAFNVQDDVGERPETDAALDLLLGGDEPAEVQPPAAPAADPFAAGPPPAADDAVSRNAPDDPLAPVSISAIGGQLILYSESQKKLNELEDLITRLGQAVPPRTQWTVFQLTRADATETAELLDSLIPSASVSGTATTARCWGR